MNAWMSHVHAIQELHQAVAAGGTEPEWGAGDENLLGLPLCVGKRKNEKKSDEGSRKQATVRRWRIGAARADGKWRRQT